MDIAVIGLRIENRYGGGAEIETTSVVAVPLPLPDEDTTERSDWEYDHIFPETGTGRDDGDAWYDVEVTRSTAPELLGLTFQFGY
ncbi:hypothetical protein NX794_07725 [Streptomyces sp. LP11]|uniref:Uncharacterized protein n=1 Tax=Streptomyces pyxinicus TaxID=2970331 RepID=A0ABT2AXZ7_9ACTN|nr:hypothetical protein [Streptomyces sp. LP11]MCS0601119.1 hypothetical protein [Streptomyces sp. LP11]